MSRETYLQTLRQAVADREAATQGLPPGSHKHILAYGARKSLDAEVARGENGVIINNLSDIVFSVTLPTLGFVSVCISTVTGEVVGFVGHPDSKMILHFGLKVEDNKSDYLYDEVGPSALIQGF